MLYWPHMLIPHVHGSKLLEYPQRRGPVPIIDFYLSFAIPCPSQEKSQMSLHWIQRTVVPCCTYFPPSNCPAKMPSSFSKACSAVAAALVSFFLSTAAATAVAPSTATVGALPKAEAPRDPRRAGLLEGAELRGPREPCWVPHTAKNSRKTTKKKNGTNSFQINSV